MSYKHDKAMKRLIARRKAYRKALAKIAGTKWARAYTEPGSMSR